MSYVKTHWENTPSEASPLNAQNLNHLEDGVENNDQRITVLEGKPVGHKILDKLGSLFTSRSKLQFTGIATVSDNEPSDKTVINIPSSLSSYNNDAGFITNTVNNLTNYYLKSETYTQAEVQALIGQIATLTYLVVQTLPTQDISTSTIYLVPKTTAETNDVYDEYLYINNAWEHIGSTQVDLTNYYTKTETDTLLNGKVDTESGKGLSSNDYTTTEKNKLSGIASGAEVNVQANWNETDNTSDAYIQNKPTIPSATSDLTNDSNFVSDANYTHTDNNYTTTEKNKLSGIEAGAQVNVQADWNQTDNTADDYIKNKPNIPSGQIQSDWSQTDNTAVDYIKNKPTIPTNVSDLQNDIGFITGVNVDDIGDVDLSNLANGQVLKYNSTSQKWENANESGGSGNGHIIEDNYGTPYAQRSRLKFNGYGVSDNSTGDETIVDVKDLYGNFTIHGEGQSISQLYVGDTNGWEGRINISDSVRSGYSGSIVTRYGLSPNEEGGLTDNRHYILPDENGFIALDNQTFTEASTRANIASGESFKTILGKIKKFFTDLKTVAFTGAYSDLSGTPTLSDYLKKTQKQGDFVKTFGGSGTYQYYKVATLTITDSYINYPIVFEISERNIAISHNVTIIFASTSSTDPNISTLSTNENNKWYITKTATSTWELYVDTGSVWSPVIIHRIYGYMIDNGVTVTLNGTGVSSIPSDSVGAVYRGNVNFANSATKATQDGNGNTITSTYVKKSGDTMTGTLNVDKANGTASALGKSYVYIGNGTAEGTAGNSQGILRIYGTSAYYSHIVAGALTNARTHTLPNKSGTFAMTSDIPASHIYYKPIDLYLTSEVTCTTYKGYASNTLTMEAGTYLVITSTWQYSSGNGSPKFRTLIDTTTAGEYMVSSSDVKGFTYFGFATITAGSHTVTMQATSNNATNVKIPAYFTLQVVLIRLS